MIFYWAAKAHFLDFFQFLTFARHRKKTNQLQGQTRPPLTSHLSPCSTLSQIRHPWTLMRAWLLFIPMIFLRSGSATATRRMFNIQ